MTISRRLIVLACCQQVQVLRVGNILQLLSEENLRFIGQLGLYQSVGPFGETDIVWFALGFQSRGEVDGLADDVSTEL